MIIYKFITSSVDPLPISSIKINVVPRFFELIGCLPGDGGTNNLYSGLKLLVISSPNI